MAEAKNVSNHCDVLRINRSNSSLLRSSSERFESDAGVSEPPSSFIVN